ncbi:MAG: DUF2062 domain-containing protein [Candidatus Competibacteraceae bacterium]|nr:DUF2062 domain-containing protein [Candidatus Competibacteraceae bacterium]
MVREHRQLQFLGERLHDPNLWHLNRRSVAGALGMGIFVALFPLPLQMVIAALAAMWLRVNLPLVVATVWITNPLTFPPIFYFNYRVGAWLLDHPPRPFHFEFSLGWLLEEAGALWQPLVVGSLAVGLVLGSLTYTGVRLAWRLHVVYRRRNSNLSRGKARRRAIARYGPNERPGPDRGLR